MALVRKETDVKKEEPMQTEQTGEEQVKETKAKKAGGKKPPATPAQVVAALLSKNKDVHFDSEVIFDPEGPLATADKWIPMPHPWQALTGVQGIPIGHITTIQGKPDGGKTTIAMHALVEAQELGYNTVVIDTEHKFNKKRLAAMGCDITNVLFLICDSVEEGFDAIDKTIAAFKQTAPGVTTVFLWDSLGMTPTEAELKGTAYSVTVASAAKVIKKNLRRQVSKISREDVAVIFVNHIYDNINALFGNSTKGYGGNGAYYAAVLVIEVAKVGVWAVQRAGKKVVLGIKSKIKCTKNHMADIQSAVAEIRIGTLGIDGSADIALGGEDMESFSGDGEVVESDFEVPNFKEKTK